MPAPGSVVLKVSGGLLTPPRAEYISRLAGVVRRLHSSGLGVVVVVGGGSDARARIAALRELGVREAVLDVVGIWSARLNALTLAAALYPLSPLRVPESLEEVLTYVAEGLVPVVGGFQPGQSTNAVAAMIAEALGGVLVNMLRDVAGVYGEDGRVIERIDYEGLRRLISSKPQVAGGYELFDHVALNIVERSGTPVYFVDGREPEAVLRVVLEGERRGTLLAPRGG